MRLLEEQLKTFPKFFPKTYFSMDTKKFKLLHNYQDLCVEPKNPEKGPRVYCKRGCYNILSYFSFQDFVMSY